MSHSDSIQPEVIVLVLNWNGWASTLHCLESLFRVKAPNLRVIVCDNASTDGSMECFEAWASGRMELVPEPGPLQPLSHPPIPKPVPWVRADAAPSADMEADTRLILIPTGANLGYGGGNNVGIRYALAQDDFDYLWILNNDTLVASDALAALLRRMAAGDVDLCGSTLLFHDRPEVIQCQAGASFHRWLGLSRLLGSQRPREAMLCQAEVERRLDHLYGASMLVSRDGLEKLGPMAEEYFLYYEEMDWIRRARRPLRLGYAPDSLVYHHKGGAAGTGTRRTRRSLVATYYLARSRIRYTARHFPVALPLVHAFGIVQLAIHAVRGDRARARILLDALLGRPPPVDAPMDGS